MAKTKSNKRRPEAVLVKAVDLDEKIPHIAFDGSITYIDRRNLGVVTPLNLLRESQMYTESYKRYLRIWSKDDISSLYAYLREYPYMVASLNRCSLSFTDAERLTESKACKTAANYLLNQIVILLAERAKSYGMDPAALFRDAEAGNFKSATFRELAFRDGIDLDSCRLLTHNTVGKADSIRAALIQAINTIGKDSDGKDGKAKDIIEQAHVNNRAGRKMLRMLESEGLYSGFSRKPKK